MSQDKRKAKTSGNLPQFRSLALVAVGSNRSHGMVDVAETVNAAIAKVSETIGVIRRQSCLFRTPAFPAGSGPDFVNAAMSIETDLAPETLLARLHDVEASFGRERTVRWGARTLDLDLIAVDSCVLPDAQTHAFWRNLPLEQQMKDVPTEVILPHPRLAERAFVLVPLAEVAPEWVHPLTGQTVRQMLSALDPALISEVRAL